MFTVDMRSVWAVVILCLFGLLCLAPVSPPTPGQQAAVVLRKMPAPWFDPEQAKPETDDERNERLAQVAHAIDDEVVALNKDTQFLPKTGWRRREFVAMAANLTYEESSLAWEVHAGEPWPGRPAPKGDHGRAICLFQLQRSAASVPDPKFRPFEFSEHTALAGVDGDATQRCVRAGVKALAWQAWRCRRQLKPHIETGDKQYAVAVIYGEYHWPTQRCIHLTSKSIKRAFDWYQFMARMSRVTTGTVETETAGQ
jgi:hypothetical protein